MKNCNNNLIKQKMTTIWIFFQIMEFVPNYGIQKKIKITSGTIDR